MPPAMAMELTQPSLWTSCTSSATLRRLGWAQSPRPSSSSTGHGFGAIAGTASSTVSSASSTLTTPSSLAWAGIKICSGARKFARRRSNGSGEFPRIWSCPLSPPPPNLPAVPSPPPTPRRHRPQSHSEGNGCGCWPFSARCVCCYERAGCAWRPSTNGGHACRGRARRLDCCRKTSSRPRPSPTSGSSISPPSSLSRA